MSDNVIHLNKDSKHEQPIQEKPSRKQYTDQNVVWFVFGVGLGFLFAGLLSGNFFFAIFGLVLGWVGWIK